MRVLNVSVCTVDATDVKLPQSRLRSSELTNKSSTQVVVAIAVAVDQLMLEKDPTSRSFLSRALLSPEGE